MMIINKYWLLQKSGRQGVGIYDYENDRVSDLVSPRPWPNWAVFGLL
jgi:hypothetical protein